MRHVVVTPVGAALETKFRAIRATFDPDLAIVQVDDYWGLKRTVASLGTRLPALLWTMGGLEFDTTTPAMRQKQLWVGNYLWKLDVAGGKRNVGYDACELVAEQFTSEQYDTDLSIDVTGVFVESVRPVSIDMSEEFVEMGLGHGLITLEVNLHSVTV